VSDDEELAKRTGQKRMAEAMDAVDEALEAYMYHSRHGGVGQARERLHVAVMTLFARMEPHLETHDEGYTDLQIKQNAIRSNLKIPEKEKNKSVEVKPKEHWLYKDELVKLLKIAEPRRARMYYLLYAGGFRIGELKRLTPTHLRRNYGENGAANVVEGRSKSEFDRMVTFQTEAPLDVFDEAPVGTWEEDENGESWDNVFFPDLYAENEYYYLGPKKYAGQVGISQRSSHSFRHVRTTDLVKATEMSDGDIRRRHGWNPGSSVIGNYVEFAPDRPPQTLEQYCEEKGVDILRVIED